MLSFLETVLGSQIADYPFLVSVLGVIVVCFLFFMVTTAFISIFPGRKGRY